MATTVYKIEKGQLGFSLTDPGVLIADAVIGDYTAFDCVVTSAAIVSTQNFDTEDVPGTFCDPAASSTSPTATTFELSASVLQDPQDPTGLAEFLWANDSGVSGTPVWFYLALAEDAAPKAIGKCFIAPQDFGGDARVVLTADLTFPIDGRPTIEFGVTADV